jgi:hypothetical protein
MQKGTPQHLALRRTMSNEQRPPSFNNQHRLLTMLAIKEEDAGLNMLGVK